MTDNLELATFGGGCFWCTEAIFKEVNGVTDVTSGYAGGDVEDPTYEQVSSSRSGHAEVIQITFDPKVISYEDIFDIFFTTHDPTTLNKQGNDEGPQYRSIIFYHNEEQKKIAEKVMKKFSDEKIYSDAIITQVEPYSKFYPAEDYHQDYFEKNPNQPYCNFVINPKLDKFRKKFKEKLKKQ